jgi:serine phosphatase RsbU (regulator of sigma subunit)
MVYPIRYYLIFYTVLIIAAVLAGVLSFSFIQAGDDIVRENTILINYTEQYVIDSVWLVNKGLELIDNTLNPEMTKLSWIFLDEYNKTGKEPSVMNLEALRDEFTTTLNGTVDLYIINSDGIIEYTTKPEVRGLDFKNYHSFYESLTQFRLGSGTAADRVVHSVRNASDFRVSGELHKYAYISTPDHRYVLEIGIQSYSFESARSELSYQEMADRIGSTNPDVEDFRVFDIYGNCVAVYTWDNSIPATGIFSQETPPEVRRSIETRSSQSIMNSTSETLNHYLFIDLRDPRAISDDSIVVSIRYGTTRLKNLRNELLIRYLVSGFAAIIAGLILSFFISKRISGSIRDIVEDVRQIADGDLDHYIRGMETEEFSDLEISINRMIRKIKQYSEELERKRAEMKIASQIQKSILPENIPVPEGYDLAATNIPALEVGGDFYDIFSRESGSYTLVLADVSGKGVPAALFMVLSRTVIRVLTRWMKKPVTVLQSSNGIFIEDSGSVSFVTLFYAVLDSQENQLRYVNAGHNPPVLHRSTGEITILEPTGPVIGLLDSPMYSEHTVDLSPGDLLVVYSDGVSEAMNPDGKMFSEERLHAIIGENHTLSAKALIAFILKSVDDFAGGEPQSDDITIMVVKRNVTDGKLDPGI